MRRLRCFGIAFAVALVAVAAAACGGGGGQTTADAEGQGAVANPNRPIEVLLRQRSDRFNAGDVDGYLAPLGPEARAFEEPIVRRAAALPLSRLDLVLGGATISGDGDHFKDAEVALRYQYKELPADNPFRVHFLYDLDKGPQGWVVTRARYDQRPEIPPPPPLWPSGPVEITRSPHFLVVARPGAPAAEFAARAEQALARLVPKLTLAVDDRMLLVYARDTKEFEDNNGAKDALAFFDREFIQTGAHPARPEGRYVMADGQALKDARTATLENGGMSATPDVVLQHELAHLALSRFTRPCTSAWVVEGAAMLLSGEDRSPQWRELVTSGKLDGEGLSDPVSYAFADAAALALVAKGGEATFFDFYQNFKNLPVSSGLCTGRVADVRSGNDERLLRRYYRFGVADLEVAARDYIRNAVGAK